MSKLVEAGGALALKVKHEGIQLPIRSQLFRILSGKIKMQSFLRAYNMLYLLYRRIVEFDPKEFENEELLEQFNRENLSLIRYIWQRIKKAKSFLPEEVLSVVDLNSMLVSANLLRKVDVNNPMALKHSAMFRRQMKELSVGLSDLSKKLLDWGLKQRGSTKAIKEKPPQKKSMVFRGKFFRFMSRKEQMEHQAMNKAPEQFMQYKAIKEQALQGLSAFIKAHGYKEIFLPKIAQGDETVKFGEDENGERYAFLLSGEILTIEEYLKQKNQKRKGKIDRVTEVDITKYKKADLRVINRLYREAREQDNVKYMALTDDIGSDTALTKVFPVVDYNGEKIIADGRFKGINIRDLINAEGRLLEGSGYVIDESGVPKKIEYEKQGDEGEGRKSLSFRLQHEAYITVDDGKLVIGIPHRAYDRNNPLLAIMQKLDDESSTIELLTKRERRENGRLIPLNRMNGPLIWTFDIMDFETIRDELGAISMSKAASKMIKEYYDKKKLAEEMYKKRLYMNITEQDIPGLRDTFEENGKPIKLFGPQKESIDFVLKKGNGVVGLDTGCGKCVMPNTMIHIGNNGFKHVEIGKFIDNIFDSGNFEWLEKDEFFEHIKVKDTYLVTAYNEVEKVFTEKEIEAVYRQKIKEKAGRLKTKSGRVLESTLVHKYGVLKEGKIQFVSLKDIKVGDRICLYFNQKFGKDCPEWLTEDFARFIAYAIAEGYTKYSSVNITQKDEKVINSLESCLRNSYINKLSNSVRKTFDKRTGCYTLHVNGNGNFVDFHDKNSDIKWDCLSKNKNIPNYIINAPKNIQQVFLRALFEAEATIGNVVSFTSASKQLIERLQMMLNNFGIMSTVKSKIKSAKNGKDIKREYFNLYLDATTLPIFVREIGFESERKYDKVVELLEKNNNPNNFVFPIQDILNRFAIIVKGLPLRTYFDIQSEYLKDKCSSYIRISSIVKKIEDLLNGKLKEKLYQELKEKKSKFSNRDTYLKRQIKIIENIDMDKIDEIVRELRFFIDNNVYFDIVGEIEYFDYEGYVYDLTIKENHNYVISNGMLIHNTLTSICIMAKWMADGTLTEKGRNGKILIVAPASLKGNFPREIKNVINNPEEFLNKVDIITYQGFVKGQRLDKPFEHKGIKYDRIQNYGAIFFDEAQALKAEPKNRLVGKVETEKDLLEEDGQLETSETQTTDKELLDMGITKVPNTAMAAHLLNHEHKVLLTASVMEKTPLDLFNLIAISENWPYEELAPRKKEFVRKYLKTMGKFGGGRVIGVKSDKKVRRKLAEFVREHCVSIKKEDNYKTLDENGNPIKADLPPFEQKNPDLMIDESLQKVYAKIAKPIMKTLVEMTNKYKQMSKNEKKMVEEGVGLLNEVVYGEGQQKRREFMKRFRMLQLLSSAPGVLLSQYPELQNDKKIREALEDVQQHPEKDVKLRFVINKINEEIDKGQRYILWTDTPVVAEYYYKQLNGLWRGKKIVCCLANKIYIGRDGKLIKEYLEKGITRLTTEEEKKKMLLRGQKPTKRMVLKWKDEEGREMKKNDNWQVEALAEIKEDKDVAVLILTKAYTKGHNLQTFKRTIHLDRNTFNNENMKQRDARNYRTGADKTIPIESYIPDVVLDKKYGDINVDGIRKFLSQLEENIFNIVVRQSFAVDNIKDIDMNMMGTSQIYFEKKAKSLGIKYQDFSKKVLENLLIPNEDSVRKFNI